MQQEIMKRAMFSMPLSKEARNSGIMAGFEDEMPPEDTAEQMPPMARTPQNPEILMNNLRGDVRSTDARYQELVDMVGEEAAMNTPPEVLAMLQTQLGQQQGGIGALPQGAAMMPPPMEGGGPMGAPGGAPAMPSPEEMMAMQGGMPPQGAMPPGMESAPPFPQGAEAPPPGYAHGGSVYGDDYPPTPDGMPPMHAQVGAFVNAGTRAAQFLSPYVTRFGDKISTAAQELNALGGRLMSQNAPTTFRPVFENVRGPMGRFTAEQTVKFPTITQHLSNVFPKTTDALRGAVNYAGNVSSGATVGLPVGGVAAGMYMNSQDRTPTDADMRQGLENQYADAYYASMGGDRSIPLPSLGNMSNEQLVDATIKYSQMAASKYEPKPVEKKPAGSTKAADNSSKVVPVGESLKKDEEVVKPAEVTPAVANSLDPLNLFINQTLKNQGTYGSRVEAKQKEMQPLFDKINAGSKDDAKTNALLLLADAGFKYASTTAATPAMALAQSLQGIPKGLAAIVAQAKDRKIKIDMAVLDSAMTRVDSEDKFFRDMQLKMADYAKAVDVEAIRQAQKRGQKFEQYPGGLLKMTDRVSGSYLGLSIDRESPLFKSATDVKSAYALIPTNPYVKDLGPTSIPIVEDADQRKDLEKRFYATNSALSSFDQLIKEVQSAYGPGAAILSGWNNTFVPFGAPLSKDTARAEATIGILLERLKRNVGSADLSGAGKQSVQEMTEAKSVLDLKPAAFFSSPEESFQKINAFKTVLLNMRQEAIENLGFVDRSYRASVAPSGTSKDPYVIPSDPKEAAYMYRHLSQNLAPYANSDSLIYLKFNGQVKGVKPSMLIGLSNTGAQ